MSIQEEGRFISSAFIKSNPLVTGLRSPHDTCPGCCINTPLSKGSWAPHTTTDNPPPQCTIQTRSPSNLPVQRWLRKERSR
ncbi:RAS guanyl-releasing protein 4 [Platysternon megacephalum]|uniref:RAS guanyl-releasing protein 4 n=1 Tax=Platysternon megacephalum TaxID=55544 RepID=A0A4D9DVV6_9SAUR|nr:RAS guanyl-releasing protein 4 [Platysternon megacephalum]